jgi:hypothetical protein
MWHKAWTQSSQGVTGRPHHLGRLTMCWRISKNLLSTCPEEVVLKVSNAQRRGNLAASPSCMVGQLDKWASCDQSSARAPPYSSYKYHDAPTGRKCEESEV